MLPTHYGFRANHSTSHALTDVLTSLYDNINDGNYTALLLLDLKKAFGTIIHKTLLTKLEHYGIRGPTLDLFALFLTDRYPYVSSEIHQSDLKKFNMVFLKVLYWNLFFLTFMFNDISTSVSCIPRLFADDICFIVEDKNQMWSRGHNLQGQGHENNPRPRTEFSRTDLSLPRTGMVEAKAKDQGHNFSKLWLANFPLFLSSKVFKILHFVKVFLIIRK